MPNTAASYARYSTDGQTENSIAYQMHEINDYCRKHEIQLTHTFIDRAMTGTNSDRNGFLDMISAAQNKEFNDIIIYDLTRGSRDVADWFYFRKRMRELNINVISCNDKLGDPLDSNDFLQELLTVGLGHRDVLVTRKKVLDGVSSAARTAKFLGGWAPFGYEIKNGRYSIVPSEAKIVEQAFKLYAAGYSYSYILNQLNLQNVVGRHGKKMSPNSLYYMFKNKRYAGTYLWNQYTYQVMRKYVGSKPNPRIIQIDNAIPAIVDKETFMKVQERMTMNKHQCKSSKRRVFLLSGLIECGLCGARYVAHASTVKGHQYTYYCCTNRYGKKDKKRTCKSKPIRGEGLEKFVVDSIKQFLTSQTDFNALAEEIAQKFNTVSIDTSAEEKELSGIDIKINNGINAILSGFDTPELRQQIENLKSRKEQLQSIINSAENSKKRIDITALADLLKSDLQDLDSQEPEIVRAAIRRHVPCIIANGDNTLEVCIGYNISSEYRHKKTLYSEENKVAHSMAGAEGLEPSTDGFGDRNSTN